MRKKLTAKFLESYRSNHNVEIADDDGPKGFSVRVGPLSAAFYVVYYRDGQKHRTKIGNFIEFDKKGGITLSEARAEAERIRGNSLHPAAAKRRARAAGTFDKVARRFIEEMPRARKIADEPDLRELTRRDYNQHMIQLVAILGDRYLDDITKEDLEEKFFEAKAETAPIQANRIFSTLRRFYNWAIKKGLATTNPCVGMELPGGEESERESDWPREKIRKVWGALDAERPMIARFFKFLFYTGLRRGEAMKLQWSWIDFDREADHPQPKFTIPPEANKTRTKKALPLSPQAAQLLRELRELTGHTDSVFIGPSGKRITTIQKAKERIARRAGVEFRTHDIRHCVATGMAERGTSSDTVSAVLGHVIGKKTTRIYERYHRMPEKRRALETWANHLDAIVGQEGSKVASFPA